MKILHKIGWLAVLLVLFACGGNETINGNEEPKVEPQLKEYTVSLKMGGEVTTSESPLARTETESDDLYGVQVYKKINGNGSYDYFAYGLFDNVGDININLLEGSTYKFEVVLVKKGKDLIHEPENGFRYPFYRVSGSSVVVNNFYYSSSSYYKDNALHYGMISVSKYSSEDVKYPEADWYYGELENYTPTVNGTVEIDLKHTVFGLQYEVTGITDGTVSVFIRNNERSFFSNSSITEDYTSEEKIIAFYDTYSAWQYADNYTENLTVKVVWTRGVGVVEDKGSKTIQVKRNVMNVVRIKMSADDGSATFGITTEDDSSMMGETVDVPLG